MISDLASSDEPPTNLLQQPLAARAVFGYPGERDKRESDLMSEETVQHMRDRILRCRQLAKSTTDERTAGALRQIADEIEADVRKLESRRGSDVE